MKLLNKYVNNKKELFKYFNCHEDYYIKVITDYKWHIEHQDGVSFLSYWKTQENVTTAVIVGKDNQHFIYKTSDYTMIIAIDCIKIAFILKNSEEI